MKKGIVAVLVLLALVVLISPGLVGRLAEQSVDDQLQWAASENREVVITAEKFDRGWFSSEGRHRVEIGSGAAADDLRIALGLGPDDAAPALIIDTHLDHGLIPVSSITRTEGSLAPGLGRAVSTISIEAADGAATRLPGVIYSNVGLDGGLTSHYFLDPGSYDNASWGAGDIEVSADAGARHVTVDGGFDSFTFLSPDGARYSVGTVDVDSDMTMTDYGFSVGDLAFSVDTVNITSELTSVNMGPLRMRAKSAVDNGRVNADAEVEFAAAGMAPIGDIAWIMNVAVAGLDADAAGRLQRAVDSMPGAADPSQLFAAIESDLKAIVTEGFELRFDRFDVTVPQGTLQTRLQFNVAETDPQAFNWAGVLLDLEATGTVIVPAGLYEFLTTMNPQINAAVAMGFLKRNGDNYEMAAEYRKGLLTVNGAPMPIPLPGS
ncbi:MAG: DUF945 family protein [Woeseiaceae bacterium]|nr:DUF945 family protein [Woeseiaceae bacterium]